MEHRLLRSTRDRKIAGVCGGIAEYLQIDPTVVRLVWVLVSLFPPTLPIGVLGYVAGWLIIPEAQA